MMMREQGPPVFATVARRDEHQVCSVDYSDACIIISAMFWFSETPRHLRVVTGVSKLGVCFLRQDGII